MLIPAAQPAGGGRLDAGKAVTDKALSLAHGLLPGHRGLGPDEIRVIACGTGMLQPRLKQAAGWLLPLSERPRHGNGSLFRNPRNLRRAAASCPRLHDLERHRRGHPHPNDGFE